MTIPAQTNWEWVRELLQRARSVGMSRDEIAQYAGRPKDLEAEVAKREPDASENYARKLVAYEIRRKRLAAAYLAGASLGQLAYLEHMNRSSINQLVRKEIPRPLRERAAAERAGKGVVFTPTQVSAMLGAVSEEEVRQLPVVAIAAKMLKSAREVSEEDANDPYLRDEARTESAAVSEGSQRRSDSGTGEDSTDKTTDEGGRGSGEASTDSGPDTLEVV